MLKHKSTSRSIHQLSPHLIILFIAIACVAILVYSYNYLLNTSVNIGPDSSEAAGTKVSFTNPDRMYRGVGIVFQGWCNNAQIDWNRFSISDRDILHLKGMNADYVTLHISGPAMWKNIAYSGRPTNPTDFNDPKYDFSFLDISVKKLREAGIEPVLQTWGTPGWASGLGEQQMLLKDVVTGNTFDPYVFNETSCTMTEDIRDSIAPPQNLNEYGYFMEALARRYNGSNNINLNLQREMVIVGDQVFMRTLEKSGDAYVFKNNWRKVSLFEYYGGTAISPISGNTAPLPLDGVDAHVFIPNGKAADGTLLINEGIIKGSRFWARQSYDGGLTWMGQVAKTGGSIWGESWYTHSLDKLWEGTTSNSTEYPRPDHTKKVVAWNVRRTGEGRYLEDVSQYDKLGNMRYWYRESTDYGKNWPKVWSTNLYSAAYTVAGAPPTNFTAKAFYDLGDVPTTTPGVKRTRQQEFVLRGDTFWAKEWFYENGVVKDQKPWTTGNIRDNWIKSGINVWSNPKLETAFASGANIATALIDGGEIAGQTSRIDHYLLWNEPNHPHFWKGMYNFSGNTGTFAAPYDAAQPVQNTIDRGMNISLDKFVTMSNFAYDRVKAVNSAAVIIGPNVSPGLKKSYKANEAPEDTRAEYTLRYLLSKGIKFDVLGQHMYLDAFKESPFKQPLTTFNNPARSFLYSKNIGQTIKILNDYPAYSNKPIINSESGYPMGSEVVTPYYDIKTQFYKDDIALSAHYFPRFSGWTNFQLFDYLRFDTGLVQKNDAAYDIDNPFYREFSKTITPTTVTIYARGVLQGTAKAQMQLSVGEQPIKHLTTDSQLNTIYGDADLVGTTYPNPNTGARWTVDALLRAYRYVHPGTAKLGINDIKVSLINDAVGIDLFVDKVVIDNVEYQTEDCRTVTTIPGQTPFRTYNEILPWNASLAYGQTCVPKPTATPTPTPVVTPTQTPIATPLRPSPTSTTIPILLPPAPPTGLSAICPAPGTRATVTWNPVAGATSYALRIDDLSNGWDATCNALSGDFCGNITSSTMNYPTVAGKNYRWWVHSVSTGGMSNSVGGTFQCAVPTTPAPTPIRTPIPTPITTPIPTPIPTPISTCTFGPYSVPGRIEAENYTCGGQGVAYNDITAGNSGNVYRFEDVDLQATADAGGGYNVAWTRSGDWMKYRINITQSGTYTLNMRVASLYTSGKFKVKVDGIDITGIVAVPWTFAWQSYTTVSIPNISLTAGQRTFELIIEGDSANYNYFDLILDSPAPVPTNSPQPSIIPYPTSAVPLPTAGLVKAVNMNGGAVNVDGIPYQAESTANVTVDGYRFANQTITLFPTVSSGKATMLRSSVWGKINKPTAAFNGLTNGTYKVVIYSWEDNAAQTFSIYLEGNAVKTNVSSGTAGSWRKDGPYTVNITDGKLDVRFTGGDANFSGIEIWK